MCNHKNFKAQVNVIRLTESDDSEMVSGYTADVEIHCADCFMPFQFIGVPGGSSPSQPMVNYDATQLRAPIKPI